MLLQKVFHVRQSLNETQTRLSDARNYREGLQSFQGFDRTTEWRGLLDSISLMGFRGNPSLELLPTGDGNQVLFRSAGTSMEICGLMELIPIRDRLTEVQLTLDYEIQSPFRKVLDRILGGVNRRVDRQIVSVKRLLEDREHPCREEAFIPERGIRFSPEPGVA